MAGLSSSERQTLEKAIDSLTLAVQLEDQSCPPHQALRHYCRGLQLLLPLLASPRCSGQYRHILQEKCCHYWSKTRHLRSLILSKSKSCRHDPKKTPNDPMNPENDDTAETRNDVRADSESSLRSDGAADSESSLRTHGAATRSNNNIEAGDLTSPDEQTTASPGTKKTKCAVTYRLVYCEVATVEVEEEEESEDVQLAEQQRALREAREVEILASQFFPTYTEDGDHDAEMVDTEDTRRRQMVPSILDAMVQSNTGRGLDFSWVKGTGVGLEDLEIALRERLVLPLTFPKIITGRYCPYLLLYGQPGDGILPLLNYLHKAWATYQSLLVSGRNLLEAVSTETITVRDLVEGLFSRAFLSAPCALCVTDFDVLGSGRQFEGSELEYTARSLKTELLVQLETLRRRQEVVIFVAVTSRPWLIDPTMRRKFSYRGYCPCPIPEERAAVFMEAIKHIPHSLRQTDLLRIAERTLLFSRADMRILADEAHAMLKLRVQEARYFRPFCSVSHSPSSRRGTTHRSSNPTHLSQNEGEKTAYQQGNSTQGIECCHRGTAKGPGEEAGEESDHKVEQFHRETDRDGAQEDATDQCGWNEENFTSPGAENPGGSDQGARDSSEDSGEEETDLKRSQENDCHACSSRNDAGAGNDTTDEGAGTLSRSHMQCSSPALSCRSNDNPKKTSAFLQNCDSCVSRNIASADHERDEGAGPIFHHKRRSSQADLSAADTADASIEADSASWPEVPVMYTPCRPWDEDARLMTWLDVDPCRLLEPDLTYEDVVAAIHHVEGEVDEDDARRMRQWHEDFGGM